MPIFLKLIRGTSTLLLLASCSTALTVNGKLVRVISASQKEKCRYLDSIVETNSSGWNPANDTRNALNQTKNRAVDLGGNAIFLLSSATNSPGGIAVGSSYLAATEALVQAEVYFCEFEDQP